MSVCIETSTVLASSSAVVGTTSPSSPSSSTLLDDHHVATTTAHIATISGSQSTTVINTIVSQGALSTSIIQGTNTVQPNDKQPEQQQQQAIPSKSIAKLVVANHSTANNCNAVLQKVVTPPLITVLNPSGPLTVVKTLCVTSGVSSAPQFTLVNSAPLNVTNAVGKSPTITLLNAPVTVVKAIHSQAIEKNIVSNDESGSVQGNATNSVANTIIENRGHNVFVKNTCSDGAVTEMTQGHKLLTTNNFSPTNNFPNLNQQQAPKTVNGQKAKVKVLGNVIVSSSTPTTVQTNVLLSKNGAPQQRYVPKQKLLNPNGASTKYLNRSQQNNIIKTNAVNPSIKLMQDKSFYATHKGQIKTLPPMNNYMHKTPHGGIKTIAPQNKSIPSGQMQRTGLGLRTIPPQRQQKVANKPNYIGKHAIQAQKMRQPHGKMKGMKVQSMVPYNVQAPSMPENKMTELTFNQALTAQIIETLSCNTSAASSHRNDIPPIRYNNAFSCPEPKINATENSKQVDDKTKSGLDALSLICQAVLLDHNYNATLPPDSPTRPTPPINLSAQINGMSPVSVYSSGNIKRGRSLPTTNAISTPSSLTSMSSTPSSQIPLMSSHRDDDAGSDISDGSERKHDTEGEETDTAPEAEAVNNDNFDGGYGDYVTRCLCGYLHDDGYMVECDRCKVWQHVQCVVKNKQLPDEYLCEVCDPMKPVDRQKARMIQQQWLRDRQFMDPKLRKETKLKEVFKPKEVISDTDSSDGEQIAHNNNVPKGRVAHRRKLDSQKQNLAKQRRDAAKEATQKRQKRRERKVVRKKVRTKATLKNHSDDENQDTWASHLPQLRQWIEKYEEAVTNHYSPELRARISSIRVNGAHCDNTQFDSTVNKCRVYTQPLTEIKYLISTTYLPPNTPVVELRGKYMLSTQHRNSGGSLTTRQHSQRPGPFLFFYRLHKDNTEVCVDTRTYGNAARFVRRSCKPNAELRHCIEKGVLHLYVVSMVAVEKNCELTIKHESHDLAAIGTTQIACACGNIQECLVNNPTVVKKNGESNETTNRKRRGRRTTSSSLPEPEVVAQPPPPPPPPLPAPIKPSEEEIESTPLASPAPPSLTIPQACDSVVTIKPEQIEPKVEQDDVKVKTEIVMKEEKKEEKPNTPADVKEVKVEEENAVTESAPPPPPVEDKKEKVKEEPMKSPPPTPISTRRSSHYKSDKEDEKPNDVKEEKSKCKKLSREERKLEAILRAIEQMEKAESRKQEHQAKQAHRRESEPVPNSKEDEKQESKVKRRRRKGRARTISQSASRRNRLNSTDSYMTSGDENLLSPTDSNHSLAKKESEQNDSRAVGLLLALSNGDKHHEKSPPREMDSNSNSAHSSPETPLSSACLLVQAAVEPLESGFKFPKTKKGLMNEWLNKVPDSTSSVSPTSLQPHYNNASDLDVSGYYSGSNKNLAALAQAATYCDANVNMQPRGSAKKRWLRQAISEDHSCDSSGRPDSPPVNDMVAPPKKRKLPRESLSNEVSPSSTPCSNIQTGTNKSEECLNQEGIVEIVYGGDGDSPSQAQMESDIILKERAAKLKQEFNMAPTQNEISHIGRLMDPRLNRDGARLFSNTDLIGTVEKTLSILGLDNTKVEPDPEPEVPKKKVKLSISEYRQRKMQNSSDKSEEPEPEQEPVSTEENNSVDSFKTAPRPRTASTSSSTSLTSTDDEFNLPDIPVKAPVFNSEPTELELQRETSSLRLKKAFGLSVEKSRPALDVDALLSLELEPKVKPIPLPSPTFPIPGSSEISRTKQQSPSPDLPANNNFAPVTTTSQTSSPAQEDANNGKVDNPGEDKEECISVEQAQQVCEEDDDGSKEEEDGKKTPDPNMFYTPDEEEQREPIFEESDVVSYVPPFNNPIYPNDSFATYTSTIDDDARYEGRNPSPPPNL